MVKYFEGKIPTLPGKRANLFVSLQQCQIRTLRIFSSPPLQSAIITLLPLDFPSSFISRSITSFASSSANTLAKFYVLVFYSLSFYEFDYSLSIKLQRETNIGYSYLYIFLYIKKIRKVSYYFVNCQKYP